MTNLKTPLRYPGGKSRAVGKIKNFFPNLSNCKEYREPFLGGGSVALHISIAFPHLNIWVNDLYEPLTNFWQILQRQGDEIASRLKDIKANTSDCRGLFEDSKSILQDRGSTPVERAIAFYIVNKCSFSGLTESSSFSRQASIQNFSMRGINKLPQYSRIIQRWTITNDDYEILLTDLVNAFVSYEDRKGTIKQGDIGGRSTDLLPKGWTLLSLDIDTKVLKLMYESQLVEVDLFPEY